MPKVINQVLKLHRETLGAWYSKGGRRTSANRRSQSNERILLVDLEHDSTAWPGPAHHGGTRPARRAGRFPAGAARLPRDLSQDLGFGLGGVCGVAPGRAL